MDKMGGMFSFLTVSIYCCISLVIYRQWNLSIFNQIVEDETQNSMDTGAELEKLKLEIKDKVRERVSYKGIYGLHDSIANTDTKLILLEEQYL
jgi:hypothetical protein